MDEIFRRLVDNNFSELAGLAVHAFVPVPEEIVNELIEVVLRGNKNISGCRVSIGEQNRISVILKTPLWLWPINLKLRVYSSVDFTASPKIRASLENKVLLGNLGSLLNALPAGISIQGSQVIIEVRSFLETTEQKNLLDLLKSVEVRTEQAKLILDIKLNVEQE